MPSAVSPNPRAGSAQPDELDRLLDFDNAVEDFLNDIPVRSNGQNATGPEDPPRDEDQEVQVKKKRTPIPKLDENRLLSDAGIPKLRKITKKSLKFRGKGHEFSDISRLLNTYQLWLDDLYPRAKFRDALAMVEKVGHSKRMQVTRRAWLDDTKPNRRLSPDPDVQMTGADGNADEVDLTSDGNVAEAAHGRRQEIERTSLDDDAPQDDELDLLMAENEMDSAPRPSAPQKRNGPFEDDEPDEDELDALLAESNTTAPGEIITSAIKASAKTPFTQDSDDELDALMAEQPSVRPPVDQYRDSAAGQRYDDFADDEEAMADMGW